MIEKLRLAGVFWDYRKIRVIERVTVTQIEAGGCRFGIWTHMVAGGLPVPALLPFGEDHGLRARRRAASHPSDVRPDTHDPSNRGCNIDLVHHVG